MKNQHREMFFFTEKYTGNDHNHQEIIHPWKNTLNYINRFSISEEDGFDIAGIFTMTNTNISTKAKKNSNLLNRVLEETYKERAGVLNHLSLASGIVHVFISGMKLYRTKKWKSRRESYVDLERIVRECSLKINRDNVESLRVSVMEFRVSKKIRPSIGAKITTLQYEANLRLKNYKIGGFYGKR